MDRAYLFLRFRFETIEKDTTQEKITSVMKEKRDLPKMRELLDDAVFYMQHGKHLNTHVFKNFLLTFQYGFESSHDQFYLSVITSFEQFVSLICQKRLLLSNDDRKNFNDTMVLITSSVIKDVRWLKSAGLLLDIYCLLLDCSIIENDLVVNGMSRSIDVFNEKFKHTVNNHEHGHTKEAKSLRNKRDALSWLIMQYKNVYKEMSVKKRNVEKIDNK